MDPPLGVDGAADGVVGQPDHDDAGRGTVAMGRGHHRDRGTRIHVVVLGLYVRAMRLNPDFESYITGWGAVIAHMSRAERVFDTALYPLLFLTVATWVLAAKSLRAGTVQE